MTAARAAARSRAGRRIGTRATIRSARYRVRATSALLAALLPLLIAQGASAQASVAAEIRALTGVVETLRKGETRRATAVVGAKLTEGDEIRAQARSSAQLDLPDGSTLVVAENSRIVIARLEVDPQQQSRQAFFHLAVGKVRAVVSQLAVTLVKARQSNFVISTPTAVAAARGTVFEVVYDALHDVMEMAVLVKDPRKPSGLVSCVSLYDRFSTVLVREGLATTASGTEGCAPPRPIGLLPDASLVGTLSNPRPPGPAFSAPVTVPSNLPGIIGGGAPPVVFTSDPGASTTTGPSSIGRDIGLVPQQPASLPSNP